MSKGKHVAHSSWTDKDKQRAIQVYKATGAILKTCDITGIPYNTIHLWMKQQWWKEWLNRAKAEDTAELEDAATNIAKQAAGVISERLLNGDHVLTKDGDLVRKPVGAKDASIVLGISLQKRKELSEIPQREIQLGTAERLLKLVEQFANFATAKAIKGVLKKQENEALEAEFVEVKENA